MLRALSILAALLLAPAALAQRVEYSPTTAAYEIGCTGATCVRTVSLTWTTPTANTDGSTPATVTGYNLYHNADPTKISPYAGGGEPRVGAIPAGVLALQIKLPVGAHAFAVTAYYCAPGVTVNCAESALSGIPTTTVSAPAGPVTPPVPPGNVTIGVVAGLNLTPVFKVTAAGKRSPEAAGFVPVGEACSGSVLFTYRGHSYRKVGATRVAFWAVVPSNAIAAPCG